MREKHERVPRKPSPATRTSLYRMTGVEDLSDGVQHKYLEGHFRARPLTVGGRDALLVMGVMETPTVSWAEILHGLTNEVIDLGNITAAAALLIRTTATDEENEADAPGSKKSTAADADDVGVSWALTYGMGFQLLDQARVDSGFGQRIAIRTVDAGELNSLTRTTLDQRARTDRASIPGGDDLRGFGAGDFGELVTRLVAKAEIRSLTGGEKPLRIRGADALSIPLGKKPEHLIKDLDSLAAILRDQVPLPELALLEQLVAVRNPDTLDLLEGDLEEALGSPEGKRLGLSWPDERIDENGTPTSFKVFGNGRRSAGAQDDRPTLDSFLGPLALVDAGKRVERLKAMKVMLYRDADATESMSSLIPGIKWVSFEMERDGRRYCLHDGRWYLMDQKYAERLRAQTHSIFDRNPGIVLPAWPAGEQEAGYNVIAARALDGLCFDRVPMTTDLHRHGIEVCDVLTREGVPIHVKDLSASAPASHLLAQALVSTSALLDDESAQQQFREKVRERGWDPSGLPVRPAKVVLGVARKNESISAANLFTFTQVTLVRQDQVLGARGVKVVIVPIDRPE